MVELPIQRAAELDSIGAPQVRGVLFTGPPGTGKAPLASLLAKQVDATFFRVSAACVFRRYVGESEGVLRRIFAEAAEQAPSVVFLDEIDALGGARAENSHDDSIRAISTLLTLMTEAPPDLIVRAFLRGIQRGSLP